MKDQGKRVALVVEGVSALADKILDALTRDDSACDVVLTHDGEEALEYLFGRGAYVGRDTRVMPCVTLLDLSLPRLGALEVLREMRAHRSTRLLPVVAFSAADKQQKPSTVYASGANSYIRKMHEVDSFFRVVREVAYYWCVLNEPPPT